MNKKQVIRINESNIRRVISESIFNWFKNKNKNLIGNNCIIKYLETKKELIDVCYLFEDNFEGFTAEWFYKYVLETGLNAKCSALAVSTNGSVEGSCIVTEEEFPYEILNKKNPLLSKQLQEMEYKCISLLVVKPQYRGGKLNFELVTKVLNELKYNGCEWAYIQVLHHLKTHDYWKRYGAIEFLDYGGVKNYMLPISGNAKRVMASFKQHT